MGVSPVGVRVPSSAPVFAAAQLRLASPLLEELYKRIFDSESEDCPTKP